MKSRALVGASAISAALAAALFWLGQHAVLPPAAVGDGAAAAAAGQQTVQGGADDSIDRPTSEPYTGDLSIFESPKRAENLQIDRVMTLLGIDAGSAVADIGAGSGWFTVRAARRVGERGAVYAVEINEKYVEHIRDRARRERLPQVRTVLGKEDDPLLPERAVDAVLILKTYHEFSEPIKMLKHIRRSMRDGARLGIIDRNGKGDDHGINAEQVIREARQTGFDLVEQHDFVKADGMDYFLIFRAR